MAIVAIEMGEYLTTAKDYLETIVSPQAEAIDRDAEAVKWAIAGLGSLNLLGLRIPTLYGGMAVSPEGFAVFQEMVARYSGALAFLQTQHQTAGMLIATGENEPLKQEYLPPMGRGDRLIGVGFSQLRRSGEPLVKAIPIAEGYLLTGNVPWVTGWKIFTEFVIGATLPDGTTLLGLAPLATTSERAGSISCSLPLDLNAFNSSNTVAIEVREWFLPPSKAIAIYPPDWIQRRDRRSIRQRAIFPLGCARAGLDLIYRSCQHKPLESIHTAYRALDRELLSCRSQVMNPTHNSPERDLDLTSHAIDLAMRCAQATVTVTGGMANLRAHPAGRIYREAVIFSLLGQTPELLAANLARIIQPECLER